MQLRSFFTAFLVVLLMTSFASAEWQEIHHYTLDETTGTTAVDSVGTVNGTLTVIEGTAGFSFDDDAITGQVGGALSFTDVDNQIIALGNDTLAFGTDDFKVSMWVKRGSTGIDDRQGLFGQGSAEELADNSMWARFDSDTNLLRFIVDKGDDAIAVYSDTAITDTSSWHLLEFAREYSAPNDETTYSIYIDGVLDNSAVDPGTPYAITGDTGAVIGAYTPSSTRNFDGAIDDIRIYTKAVPEPSTIILLAFGFLGFLGLRRR